MNSSDYESLQTSDGRAALAEAAALSRSPADELAALAMLRKKYPPALATAAVETALLRLRAAVKFPRAGEMLFTRPALEMASSEAVAAYRAMRFARFSRVLDLGCGLGGDTIALAATGAKVHAVDREPLMVALAKHNVEVHGLQAQFQVADITVDPLPEADAAFADPGRRAEGKRYLAVKDYSPPPKAIRARFPRGFPLAFKLAPGIASDDQALFDGEIEFLESDGELKECIAWLNFGEPGRRATVLTNGEAHSLFASEECRPAGGTYPIRSVLYDPSPAVVRAGLVPMLGGQLNASPIDFTVQMLSADEAQPTPFATAYHVEAVLPFDERKVRAYLQSHGVGRVTIVKRGAKADASEASEKWKLRGDEHRFVIVTRQACDQVAVVARS